jgi:hypothetical protein
LARDGRDNESGEDNKMTKKDKHTKTDREMLKELIELYEKNSVGVIKIDYLVYISLETILFNHDFAKVVFGTEDYWLIENTSGGYEADDFYLEWIKAEKAMKLEDGEDRMRDEEYAWRYHLQQLAITPEKDRIKYAYDNRRKEVKK